MAVSVHSFLNSFSEFRKTDPQDVQAKLNFAAAQVNTGIWGARANEGVMYMTAHLLSLAAAGKNARFTPQNAALTPYKIHFDQIKRQIAFGHRLAGAPPASAFDRPIE